MAISIFPNLREDPSKVGFTISINNSIPASIMGTKKGKRLTDLEKNQIVYVISINHNNNKLKNGMINKITSKYAVSKITISWIWRVILQSIKNDEQPITHKKYKGNNQRYVWV